MERVQRQMCPAGQPLTQKASGVNRRGHKPFCNSLFTAFRLFLAEESHLAHLVSLCNRLAESEFKVLELAADATIARHGDITELVQHFPFDTRLCPGRDQRAVAELHGQFVLVELFDVQFEDFDNVLVEE